jgi:DNA invertase Pin-like site-specific DNA recombinase
VKTVAPKRQRCAIYTRKSTEHNLDLAFNSLDAQREACEAYIKSQAHEGWVLVRDRFDDGGLSGASLDRPALQDLLNKVRARQIDIVVVYKVDRLTRSAARPVPAAARLSLPAHHRGDRRGPGAC